MIKRDLSEMLIHKEWRGMDATLLRELNKNQEKIRAIEIVSVLIKQLRLQSK